MYQLYTLRKFKIDMSYFFNFPLFSRQLNVLYLQSNMFTMYLFISGAEIFIILVIVVMLFGADKIPELARGLGKGMQQLKNATNEVKKEITDTAKKQGIDTDFTRDIKEEVSKIKNKVKENIEDITGPVKRGL